MGREIMQKFLLNVGRLAKVDDRGLTGWAIGNDSQIPVELAVLINGEERFRIVADEFRQDLRDRGVHPDGKCGFRLLWPEGTDIEDGDEVEIRPIGANVAIHSNPTRLNNYLPTISTGLKNWLIVGHSHIGTLNGAYENMSHPGLDACFIQLHRYSNRQGMPARRDKSHGLNSVAMSRIKAWLAAFGGHKNVKPTLVICPWGNMHNALGMVKSPVPLDFVLPAEPDLPLSAGGQYVPYRAMREMMEEKCKEEFLIATQLSGLDVTARYWIEPPPPIADEKYIRSHPGLMKAAIETNGVGPAHLRYKLWRLQSIMISRWCEDNGWTFIPVPDAVKDEQGFLCSKAWNYYDATHGNGWYGKVMLEQIHSATENPHCG